MKNAILLMAAICGLSGAAAAQKLTASKVPSAVKASFVKIHADVKTVSWEKAGADFEAGFTLKGTEVSEVYTASGSLLETETEINPSEFPAPVKSYLAANYKGAKVKEAAKIVKANGTVNYEAEIGGKDVIFDQTGKPVK